MCQEGPGDVKISDTAQAPEGPDDLLGKTHQSLESRGRRPTSSWPVWWGGGGAGLWSSQAVLTSLFSEKVMLFTRPTGLTRLAGVAGLGVSSHPRWTQVR